jgi:hypothetical protein
VRLTLRVTAFVMALVWLREHAPGLLWPLLLCGLSAVEVEVGPLR